MKSKKVEVKEYEVKCEIRRELAEDLESMYSIDVAEELNNILLEEIIKEKKKIRNKKLKTIYKDGL